MEHECTETTTRAANRATNLIMPHPPRNASKNKAAEKKNSFQS